MDSVYKTFQQMNSSALSESLKSISGKLAHSASERRLQLEGAVIPMPTASSPLGPVKEPMQSTPPRPSSPPPVSPRSSRDGGGEMEKEEVYSTPESSAASVVGSPPPVESNGEAEMARLPSRRGSLVGLQKKAKSDATLNAKQLKSEEYRQFFHLPAEENLIEDFNCALQKKILLQGHLYLFDRYVCFYSNIFGYEKKKAIPLKDVTCVRKAKTAALFPNAIEIVAWGKKHFFASFLSRDEAHRLLIYHWSQHSGYAKLFLGTAGDGDSLAPIPPYAGSRRVSWAPSSSTVADLPMPDEPGSAEEVVRPVGVASEEPSSILTPSTPLPDSLASSLVDKLVDTRAWEVLDAEAPEVPDTFKTILDTEIATSSKEFFRFFFSDDASEFSFNFHTSRGDEDFRCSHWKENEQGHHTRDLSFRHPINFYFGPKSTFCSITQEYKVYRGNHLVISTAQSMDDIPYGDYFRVEVRWDVEDIPNRSAPCCNVRISLDVPFTKKTVWKGKIEQGAIDECRETYQAWVKEANSALVEARGDSVAPTRFPTVPGTPRTAPININLNVGDEAVLSQLERKIPAEYEAEIRRMLNMDTIGSRSSNRSGHESSVYLDGSSTGASPRLSKAPSLPGKDAAQARGYAGEAASVKGEAFSVLRMLKGLGSRAMESEVLVGQLKVGLGILAVVLVLLLQAYVFLWMRSSEPPGGGFGMPSAFRSSFEHSSISGAPPPFDICGINGCTGKLDLATAEGRMVAYWEQRLRLMREDMNLLEQRLQMLTREYGQSKKQFEADLEQVVGQARAEADTQSETGQVGVEKAADEQL